jgi:hypothetical protein
MTPEELKECREAFQSWCIHESHFSIMEKDDSEDYLHDRTSSAWYAWQAVWKSRPAPEKIEAETLDHAALACQRLVSSYRMEAEDQQIEGNTVIARYFIDKAAAAFQCMLAINHLPRKYKK